MNSVLIIYITHAADEFKTGALDHDHSDQIGLQISTTGFEKIVFHYTFKLEL